MALRWRLRTRTFDAHTQHVAIPILTLTKYLQFKFGMDFWDLELELRLVDLGVIIGGT